MSEKRAKKPAETPGTEAPEAVLAAPKRTCPLCAEKDAKIAELETALRVLAR